MSIDGVSVTEMFQRVLADPEGKKMFSEAVALALADRRYNIDAIGTLAAAIESFRYASVHMAGKPRFPDAYQLLAFAAGKITTKGPVLEFGVFQGNTINHLARLLPSSTIYGFDSFEGLPEAWSGTSGRKGTFSLEGKLPATLDNVELVVGWFNRTLPSFLDTHEFNQISLLHIDCDIYSSAQTIFACLYNKIASGTIIVFDEYFNYPNWERHEYRAFQEFVDFRQLKYEYIGLVPSKNQVALRIL
jgi:hypothetical protein